MTASNKTVEHMETKIEIFTLDKLFNLYFIYVPKGYKTKSITMEQHKSRQLGRLKSFNRIKLLEHWKKQHGDLVKFFTSALENRGCDFDKYPNPIAFLTMYIDDNDMVG